MQLVFRALADPTRRAVIELLSQAPRSIGEINSEFDVSRNAIVKHLRILEEAGIVCSNTVGRERINHLKPQSLQQAADWLTYFDRFWDDKLEKLKHAIEDDFDDKSDD